MYLEFGVSKRTALSLMSLGLSRSSAVAISEFIKDEGLSEAQCLDWLRTQPWTEYDLPSLIKDELVNTLRRNH